MTLPDDKRPQERQALRDFPLLGVACHALIVGRRSEHLIARILQAQASGNRAAFDRPFSAPSAFGDGN